MTKKTIIIIVAVLVIVMSILIYTAMSKKEWQFIDNVTGTQGIGFRGIERPPFNVGDIIEVKQHPGAKHSEYNGKAKIVDIRQAKDHPKEWVHKYGDQWVVSINKYSEGDSPVNPGLIIK
jgi:hypothetical protein